MTVFFDIDTQLDFMLPAGALYVPGAERLIPAVALLNRFAAEHSMPLISTADAHAENDPEFHKYPPHCVAGTLGQAKPQATLLAKRRIVSARVQASVDIAPQVILEKTTFDAFSNPNLPALLDGFAADRYVVYGVVTEICVRHALWGLLERGRGRVELVTDAVRSLAEPQADAMIADFKARGGFLTTVGEICG